MAKGTTRSTQSQRAAPAPTTVPPRNPYEVLGVPPGVTEDQLKLAYYRLASLYHPDRNPEGAAQMAEINVAYNALCSVAVRAKANATYLVTCPGCGGKGTKQRKQGFKMTQFTCPTCKGAKLVQKT
jgi:DnaJ-class molecular chaperone